MKSKSFKSEIKSNILWLTVIFITALILRLIFLFQARSVPFFSIPIMDMAYHHQWAVSISQGKEFIPGAFFRAPLYPYFLGLIYFLCGVNLTAVIIIQIFLGSLSASLAFLIANNIFNKRIGITAGFITVFYGPLIFYNGLLLIPTLAIFLNLLSLYFFIIAIDRSQKKYIILSGLFLGLSAIARPTVLLSAVIIIIWLIWHLFKEKMTLNKKSVIFKGYTFLFFFALIIPIIPVTAYNIYQSGEFTLIGTYGGLNFYIGNNHRADGVSAKLPGARKDWWGMMEDAQRLAEKEVGHPLTTSEQSNFWFKKGIGDIFHYPFPFVKLLVKKTLLLCEGNEFSNNFDFYFFAHKIKLLSFLISDKIIFIPYGIIFPLAIVGLFLGGRFNIKAELLTLFIIAYIPTIVLFFVTARYRLPLAPLFIIFASFGIDQLIRQFYRGHQKRFLFLFVIFLSFLILSNTDIYGYKKKNDAQGLYTTALLYAKMKNKSQEELYYQKAIAEDTTYSEAYNNLGLLLASQGEVNKAVTLLEKAVKFDRSNFMFRYNLGYLYLENAEPQKAISPLKAAIKTKPDFLYALNNLGSAYMKIGQFDSAVVSFHQAIAVDPKFTSAYFNLAITFDQMRQLDSARYYYEKTLRLDSNIYNVYYQLGWLWLKQNKVDSSLINFKRYLQYAPPDAQETKKIAHLVDSLSKH